MKMKLNLFFVLALLIFLSGCDKLNIFGGNKPKENPSLIVRGPLVAKVNNLPISLEDMNREIDVFNASIDLRPDISPESKKSLKIDTREKKINYLKDEMIRRMVFYQAALDRGIDRKEDIVNLLERSKIAILSSEMQNELIKNIEVSNAEVEEAYKAIKDRLKQPDARKISEIVTKTEDEARQAMVELYQQGTDFGTLARNRSIAASAKNGGDLGFLQIGQRGPKYKTFDEVAFSPALKKGHISQIFQGPEGFYIVKIDEVKEGKQPTLTEVWSDLKERLLMGKQQEELDTAYTKLSDSSKIKVEVYEGEIKN